MCQSNISFEKCSLFMLCNTCCTSWKCCSEQKQMLVHTLLVVVLRVAFTNVLEHN